ncbi:MAG: hypothetical protein AAGI11_08090 [Pseudomonadota bacterium]
MAAPTREAMLEFARYYQAYWNNGDKEAWVANWKKIAPGDFLMYDPVGTPPKKGFDNVAANVYDLFQPFLELNINQELMYVCGNEMCWVMENTFTKDGETSVLRSVEVFKFDEQGSVEIYTYYDVPDEQDEVKGELFATYLPGV